MTNMVKVISSICITAFLFTSIIGCSKSQNTPGNSVNQTQATTTQAATTQATTPKEAEQKDVTLRFTWWGGETRHKATVEALEKLREKYPHIKVEPDYSGWSGYFEKILTQLAANTAADIVQLSYTNAGEYVIRKQIQPLDEFINDKTIHVEDLPGDTVEMYKFDGKYYAIPAGTASALLFYNKDVFDKYSVSHPTSGWNWDDYFKAAKELTRDTDGDGKIDLWGTAHLTAHAGADITFQKYLYERGGKMWNSDLTKVAFNSPEGLEAFKFIKRPLEEGIMPPMEVTAGNPQGVDDFVLGRAAMIINVAPSTQSYQKNADFNFGIERIPSGLQKKAFWLSPSMVFSITKDCKNPKEASMVIDYLVNDGEASKILKMERGVPANKKLRDGILPTLSDMEKRMMECIELTAKDAGDVEREAFPPGFVETLGILNREIESMMFNAKTPEQALKDAEAATNAVMDKFYAN